MCWSELALWSHWTWTTQDIFEASDRRTPPGAQSSSMGSRLSLPPRFKNRLAHPAGSGLKIDIRISRDCYLLLRYRWTGKALESTWTNPLRIWLNELNLEELARRELLWLLLGIDGAMVLEGISVGLPLAKSATVVWLPRHTDSMRFSMDTWPKTCHFRRWTSSYTNILLYHIVSSISIIYLYVIL